MLHVRSRDGIKKDGEISIVGADRHAQAGQQPFGRTSTRGMAEQPHDPGHAWCGVRTGP
jgi:hypothetical protein